MMQRLDLEITIEGPFVTTGVVTRVYGIDTAVLRNHLGDLILPGTLVKGVIRDVLEQMKEAAPNRLTDDLDVWFGTESDSAMERGKVRFKDLRAAHGGSKPNTATRIRIDAGTGSVAHGALQVIETPFAIGERVAFAGQIEVDAPVNATTVRTWVSQALELVPALGAIKSAGFGRVLGATVSPATPLSRPRANGSKAIESEPASLAAADVVRYVLMFEEPFLVGSESIGGNLFKGSTVIPGGAVKGALADDLERAGKLTQLSSALDKVVFRHAKPVKLENGRLAPRPRVMPLSLYTTESATSALTLRDALTSSPESDASEGAYVTFQPDWKWDDETLGKLLAPYGDTFKTRHDIRTRTKIDATGLAVTGQLFSRLAVVPDKTHVWVGEVARGDASERDFREIVASLNLGLTALGKTQVGADVAILESTAASISSTRSANGRSSWRIVLETDALMHGPGAPLSHDSARSEPRARLKAQYLDYFEHALSARPGAGEVGLEIFYAMQRWVGDYQARRFPHHTGFYYPQLVTSAGSVFVIDIADSLEQRIDWLANHGLPLPAGIPAMAAQHDRSAFIPENGYGEVTIDRRDLVTRVT